MADGDDEKYWIMRWAMAGLKIASPLSTATIALHNLILIRIFEQVAARARAHRRENRVIVVEHGKDQHADFGIRFRGCGVWLRCRSCQAFSNP